MKRALAALAATLVAGAAAAATLSGPDPSAQAQADGCGRDQAAIVKREGPEWAYVGDARLSGSGPLPLARWASGVVDSPVPWLASHPAAEDLPFTHAAYDVNFNVRVDAASSGLLGGNPAAGTGNYARGGGGEEDEQSGRLHIEREETSFPAFAWPEAGDRVSVQGAWTWDCGHWSPGGERTELHPFWALWVQRALSARSPSGETEGDLLVTNASTPAGVQEDCAHSTKGDHAAFHACVTSAGPGFHDLGGRYSFFLPTPRRPSAEARLRIRVLDEGSNSAPEVSARPTRKGVTVSFEIPGGTGRAVTVAKRVLVGWTRMPAARRPVHLRVTFQRLLVRRAMDPGCPAAAHECGSRETTRGDQISAPPGEWLVYLDAAGIWHRLPLLHVRNGQTVELGRSVDLYLPGGRPWRVLVFTRECDFGALHIAPCPASSEFASGEGDDDPGVALVRFRSPEASLGEHRVDARLDSGSTCPPSNRHGCYRMTFRVQRVR